MCINQNAESLNRYFTELASKLINKENVAFDQTKLATIIPEQESDGEKDLEGLPTHFNITSIIKNLRKSHS